MTKEEFIAQLDRGVASSAAFPVTSAVLRWTADELRLGEPGWWKAFARAWQKREFVAWSEAWGLYLNALHFEALSDQKSPLSPYFPSCGGTAEAEPAPGLAKFFAAPTASFLTNLHDRNRRSFVAGRATLWIPPAMIFFQKRGLPYYVVEVNAGAGLNLAADVVTPQKGFDPELVAARIGLDPQPFDLSDPTERRWLKAGLWPDNTRALAEFEAAVYTIQRRLESDASFIQMAACAPENVAAFLDKNVPADDSDVGLLIFNTATTTRMNDAAYAAYSETLTNVLSHWGDRGLWVEIENVRGETFSTTQQLRVHRVVDGKRRTFVMATFDVETAHQVLHDGAAAFLNVK